MSRLLWIFLFVVLSQQSAASVADHVEPKKFLELALKLNEAEEADFTQNQLNFTAEYRQNIKSLFDQTMIKSQNTQPGQLPPFHLFLKLAEVVWPGWGFNSAVLEPVRSSDLNGFQKLLVIHQSLSLINAAFLLQSWPLNFDSRRCHSSKLHRLVTRKAVSILEKYERLVESTDAGQNALILSELIRELKFLRLELSYFLESTTDLCQAGKRERQHLLWRGTLNILRGILCLNRAADLRKLGWWGRLSRWADLSQAGLGLCEINRFCKLRQTQAPLTKEIYQAVEWVYTTELLLEKFLNLRVSLPRS